MIMKVQKAETKKMYTTKLKPSVIEKLKTKAKENGVSAARVLEDLIEKMK